MTEVLKNFCSLLLFARKLSIFLITIVIRALRLTCFQFVTVSDPAAGWTPKNNSTGSDSGWEGEGIPFRSECCHLRARRNLDWGDRCSREQAAVVRPKDGARGQEDFETGPVHTRGPPFQDSAGRKAGARVLPVWRWEGIRPLLVGLVEPAFVS